MESINVNGELILELSSRQDWVRRVPGVLPEKFYDEVWLWVDKNGNVFLNGADFIAAEKQDSYPCKIYRLQKVSSVK